MARGSFPATGPDAARSGPLHLAMILTATVLAASMGAVVVVAASDYAVGIVLATSATVITAHLSATRPWPDRLPIFWGLLALSDLGKRFTLVIPGQSAWSQYGFWLIPWIYFMLALLVPALLTARRSQLRRLDRAVLAFVAISLLNTLIAPGSVAVGRISAVLFLIVPWTMVSLASRLDEGAQIASERALLWWAIPSVGYALVQFVTGPTPIDVGWADASAGFSLGAATVYRTLATADAVWRVQGFQADPTTFTQAVLAALAAGWLLRRRRRLGNGRWLTAAGLLLVGLVLPVRRTAWVALITFVSISLAVRRYWWLGHPRNLVLALASLFVGTQILAAELIPYSVLATGLEQPWLRQAVTTGTLGDRVGALESLGTALRDHWLLGMGYGLHPWITSKFGSTVPVDANFGHHNVVLEQLSLLGAPGLVAMGLVLTAAFSEAHTRWRWQGGPTPEDAVRAGIVLGYILTGFASGGVFLDFYFFYFLGTLGGAGGRGTGARCTGRSASPASQVIGRSGVV